MLKAKATVPLSLGRAGKAVAIHQGALGDFLLAVPIFESLHRSYPLIRIDLWSKPGHAALLSEKPYIGKEPPPDDTPLLPFYHDELWKTASIPPFLDESLAVFVFGQDGSRMLAERLASRIPCPVHWIQSFPKPGVRQHVHYFLFAQFRQSGWAIKECPAKLRPSPREVCFVRDYLQSKRLPSSPAPIVLHPGSGGLRKIWPLKNWATLLEILRSPCNSPVCVTLGPADEPVRLFASKAETRGTVVVEGFSLPRLAALLSQCRLFVGSDSGVSHLASLLGVPTVVIFGPTDPAVWAPRGPNVHILKEDWKESEVLDWASAPDADDLSLNPELLRFLRHLPASGL